MADRIDTQGPNGRERRLVSKRKQGLWINYLLSKLNIINVNKTILNAVAFTCKNQFRWHTSIKKKNKGPVIS